MKIRLIQNVEGEWIKTEFPDADSAIPALRGAGLSLRQTQHQRAPAR